MVGAGSDGEGDQGAGPCQVYHPVDRFDIRDSIMQEMEQIRVAKLSDLNRVLKQGQNVP